jgi:hypothetical protein
VHGRQQAWILNGGEPRRPFPAGAAVQA